MFKASLGYCPDPASLKANIEIILNKEWKEKHSSVLADFGNVWKILRFFFFLLENLL